RPSRWPSAAPASSSAAGRRPGVRRHPMQLPSGLAGLDYCYLTTTGRKSGQPREIEIWFGADGGTLYLLSGGGDRSHWVRNILADPRVRVRVGEQTFAARARVVEPGTEED